MFEDSLYALSSRFKKIKKVGLKGCPEMLVTNYQSMPHSISEE
jgi:hypothetical protein